MKTFKEFINEASDNTIIYTNLSAVGSSLVKPFTDKESADILNALKSNASRSKLADFISSAEDEDEKYSETISIITKSLAFTLYAANGQLRIGGGGNNTSAQKLLMDISAKDLIKWLPNAGINSRSR